jgi:hypothetical protein
MKACLLRNRLLYFLFFSILFLLIFWRCPTIEFYTRSADHGYQLSLGKLIFMGKMHFVDLFSHYGPLAAYSSAIGLWIHNSLISETVLCSLGYAIAIFLVFYLVKRNISFFYGITSCFVALLFQAKFYKWYYWLFPLVTLYFIDSIIENQNLKSGKRLYIAGIAGGIGGLYRLDLGIVSFSLFIIMLFLMNFKDRNIKLFLNNVGKYWVGFVIPFFGWFGLLILEGGSISDYISASIMGGIGVVEYWSKPMPTFDWNNIFSVQSASSFAFILSFFTCLICFCAAFSIWIKNTSSSKGLFAIAASLLGLGLFPQGFYRAGLGHLLQVLPPALISGSFLFYYLWTGKLSPDNKFNIHTLFKNVGLLFILLSATTLWGIRASGSEDMSKMKVDIIQRINKLEQGISSVKESNFAKLIFEIQARTRQNENILVIPLSYQIYYFSNRQVSGFLNCFSIGILDNWNWRIRNLKEIEKDPPTLIVVGNNFFNLNISDDFKKSQPELYLYLLSKYRNIVYKDSIFMLIRE